MPDLTRLLLEFGADVDAINSDGNNSLHCAAYRGHTQVCELLLDAGATVDYPDGLTGKNALIKAVHANQAAVVDLLLRFAFKMHGVHTSLSFKDSNGLTALIFAAAFGHRDILKVLLAARADPNEQVS